MFRRLPFHRDGLTVNVRYIVSSASFSTYSRKLPSYTSSSSSPPSSTISNHTTNSSTPFRPSNSGNSSPSSYSSPSFPSLSASLEVIAGDWNDNFVIVNKPCGMSVQYSKAAPSIETIINQRLGSSSSSSSSSSKSSTADQRKVYFPHRLDKASSGALAVAFHRPTVVALNQSLADHQWTKRYRVLAHAPSSIIVPDMQTIIQQRTRPLKKRNLSSLYDSKTNKLIEKGIIFSLVVPLSSLLNISSVQHEKSANFSVSLFPPEIIPDAEGYDIPTKELLQRAEKLLSPSLTKLKLPYKLAITSFQLVSSWNTALSSSSSSPLILDSSLVCLYEAQPITGRTHQLRVHFSECGVPILGDPYYTYGGLDNNQDIQQNLKIQQVRLQKTYSNRSILPTLASSSSMFANFQPQGNEMGLQSYYLAFPFPHSKSVSSQKKTGSSVPESISGSTLTSVLSSSSSSSSSSKSTKFIPGSTAVRGTLYDSTGRLSVNLPLPKSWKNLLKSLGGSTASDSSSSSSTPSRGAKTNGTLLTTTNNKNNTDSLRIYNEALYKEWKLMD